MRSLLLSDYYLLVSCLLDLKMSTFAFSGGCFCGFVETCGSWLLKYSSLVTGDTLSNLSMLRSIHPSQATSQMVHTSAISHTSSTFGLKETFIQH